MRAPRIAPWLIGIALGATGPATAEPPAEEAAETAQDRLRRTVEWLASPDLHGRREEEDRKAVAAGLAERFAAAGLKPLPGAASMVLESGAGARNVVGWLPGAKAGATADAAGEYVLVSANHDHLGMREETLMPGADLNASGVAALLEAARGLAADVKAEGKPLRRSVVFVAFDLKEQGLQGSRGWIAKPPLPPAECVADVCLEMLGRSIADLVPGSFFVMGTENSAGLEAIAKAQPPPAGGAVSRLPTAYHFVESDYVPFRGAKVPYAYLSAGVSTDWQKPTDVPERIAWEHLAARAEWARAFVRSVAQTDARPTWREEAGPTVDEVKTLRELFRMGRATMSEVKMPPMVTKSLDDMEGKMDAIIAAGQVTQQDRLRLRMMLSAVATLSSFVPR